MKSAKELVFNSYFELELINVNDFVFDKIRDGLDDQRNLDLELEIVDILLNCARWELKC